MEASIASTELGSGPIDVIQCYLDVITTSTDVEEIRAVDNLYKPLFDVDPPWIKSWEDFTGRVASDIEIGDDPSWSRVGAVVHLVRSMVQGNLNYPTESFKEVIDRAKHAITQVEPSLTPELAEQALRAEIADVWEPYRLQTDEEYERAAAAFMLVSTPRAYKIERLKNGLVRRIVKATGF